MLLKYILKPLVQTGRLQVTDPKGRTYTFGPGGDPHVKVRFKDYGFLWQAVFWPSLAIGEAYMDGRFIVEEGSIYDFLDICTRTVRPYQANIMRLILTKLCYPLRWIKQFNPTGRAKANVAHHYDLSSQLYELFLDKDRQYSCAYFPTGKETIEEAQQKKKKHIAAKLLLKPGQSVLDIGSGWGGMAIYLAQLAGVNVTGITLSEEQYKYAQERAQALGLEEKVGFALRDYRNEQNIYDRIVSVGMFEHVGVDHYGTFFRTLKRLLKPDGVALLHSIGHYDTPGSNDPWVNKYIFPGSYTPSLSEVFKAVERAGLWVCDVEILRLHYAETLKAWRQRFMSNWDKAAKLYDERFCRMWEFYLAACEIGFRNLNLMVFQMQLSPRRDIVPLTRDYITDFDRAN